MEPEIKNRQPIRQILIFGCISGAGLAVGYLFLTWLWQYLLPEARWFSSYYGFHLLLFFTVALALIGLLAGDRFGTADRSWRWTSGVISGTVTALVFLAIISILGILTGSAAFLLSSAESAGILMASIVLQAICVEFRQPRYAHRPTGKLNGEPKNNPPNFRRYGIAAAVLLSVMILPPLFLYAGISSSLVWGQPAGYLFNDNVVVTRTGPDSLSIVMHPDPKATFVTAPYVSSINLKGYEVGSQLAITASGREDTIDSPEGLAYREGASATFRGIDAAGDGTVPVRLIIVVAYPDSGELRIVCDREI